MATMQSTDSQEVDRVWGGEGPAAPSDAHGEAKGLGTCWDHSASWPPLSRPQPHRQWSAFQPRAGNELSQVHPALPRSP